jgi:flagellar hook-associated protein 2
LQLIDDPAGAASNLLTSANQGANTNFKLNGVAVSKKTSLINDVVPGITFTVLGTTTGTESVTLSLKTSRSQLSSALGSFADAYNAMSTEMAKHSGQGADLLSGESVIVSLNDTLRQIGSYQDFGNIKNLSDLGLEFDASGKLALNSTVFDNLSDSAINDAFTFIGSATTGFAGLSKKLGLVTDPAVGLIQTQQHGYEETDRRLKTAINDLTDKINYMQDSLAERLHSADALLAQLSSQQSILDASLKSVSLVLFGKQDK